MALFLCHAEKSMIDLTVVGNRALSKEDMFKLAHKQANGELKTEQLLLETLKVQDEKKKPMIEAAKHSYENAMRKTSELAKAGKAKLAKEWYDLAHKFVLWAGDSDFDAYMLASEWNREPSAKFWAPRRAVLEGKHKLATQIQEFIDDEDALFLSLSTPPGAGKSTLIKFLLSYIAGLFPQSANIYTSYSDGMSKMMYDSVVSMLTDTSEYGHNDIFDNGMPTLSAEYNTISYRKKGDFPTIGVISLGGSVTGRTRANKFMITDDLVKNAEVARNPQRLETLWQDYRDTLTTRQIGDNVKQIMLGTIWSLHDPISRMRTDHEGDPRYRFIAIPVCDDNGHSNFNYNCADRYTDKKIRDIKTDIDNVTFSCLYMQQPMEREGLLFHKDEMNWYNGTLPDGSARRIAVCDVAWGGDYLAMPIGYLYEDGSLFLQDVVFSKGDKKITQPMVVAKSIQHQIHQERFEGNNGGGEYADEIDKQLRAQNVHINISSKRASTAQSKLSRILQYAPDIKQVYYRNDNGRGEMYDKFLENLFAFNQSGKNAHDDAPDSMAQLCAFATNGVGASVEIIKRII